MSEQENQALQEIFCIHSTGVHSVTNMTDGKISQACTVCNA
jgi:hypothetical protein